MDEIIAQLKELKVSEYKIVQRSNLGTQWYFIQDKLDLSRAINSKTYELTIYQTIYGEKERYRGYATGYVVLGETLKQSIVSLMEKAKLMRNPYFDLPELQEQLEPYPFVSKAQEMMTLMQREFSKDQAITLTSYDFSESFQEVRIVNSKGLDITYTFPSCSLQYALKYQGVSLFKHYQFGLGNIAELTRAIVQSKEDIQALSEAQYLDIDPQLPVLISRESVINLLLYYVSLLSNHRQRDNAHLIPDGMKIELMAYLENSSRNFQYDWDGRIVKDLILYQDNCLMNYYGNYIDSVYSKKASSAMNNFKVSGGTKHFEDFESYLDIVELTDFNVDLQTGLYRGVIRLAYYHQQDGTVTPMSHGFISGNLNDKIYLSEQLKKYDYAVVPRFVYLPKIKITA